VSKNYDYSLFRNQSQIAIHTNKELTQQLNCGTNLAISNCMKLPKSGKIFLKGEIMNNQAIENFNNYAFYFFVFAITAIVITVNLFHLFTHLIR